MDKCTFCAGGPEENGSEAEYEKYGSQSPRGGQAAAVRRDVFDQGAAGRRRRRGGRHLSRARDARGKGADAWGWATAYGKQEQTRERTQEREQKREGAK
jgi:formate dehydrogenase iron-sulfur subunit